MKLIQNIQMILKKHFFSNDESSKIERKYRNLFMVTLALMIIFFSIVISRINIKFYLQMHNDEIMLKIEENLDGKKLDDKIKELEELDEITKVFYENEEGYKNLISEYDNNILKNTNEEKNLFLNIEELNKKLVDLKKENIELTTAYKQISSYKISNIPTIKQYPSYPTGCEGIALLILLKYYKVDISAQSIMNALPKGEKPYYEGTTLYGGNPNYEFLGDPTSNNGWGIWDKGLAKTAEKFKSGIKNGTGMNFASIYKIIRSNRPAVVWTSVNLKDSNIYKTWIYKPTGETINWKKYNHTVVVIGYTESKIIVSDPIDGTIKSFDKTKFVNMYNYMGKRAIYY